MKHANYLPFWAEVKSLSSHIPHVHTELSIYMDNKNKTLGYKTKREKECEKRQTPEPYPVQRIGAGWTGLDQARTGLL